MLSVLSTIHRIVWGVPTLVLILGVGVFLSIRTGFAQLFLMPKAFHLFFQKTERKNLFDDSVSPHQALCTALAATVGTGNLAGVAGAIAVGGPGAVFWMWICALLGMVTKFAEATLASHFRTQTQNGEYAAGPMYVIAAGMGQRWKWLACVYCFFGVVASFGVGNATQVNAVLSGINGVISYFGGVESTSRNFLVGMCLAFLVALMMFGGARKIGTVAEKLVPFASVFYLLLCLFVLTVRFSFVDDAIVMIVRGAFTPKAVTGGILGSFFQSLRVGAARGVFTNEAGLGTAGIAHGSAKVSHPVEQGMMGIIEVFVDTIVICTMTAVVILCSGIPIPYGTDVGAVLTIEAFSRVCGDWVCIPISIALCLFAIATILGWGLYGRRCAQYLFGDNIWKPFQFAQIIMVVVGAIVRTEMIWLIAEIVNGMMAIPNLIALLCLCPVLTELLNKYRNLSGRLSAYGGTNENINQCKPLRAFSHEKVSSSGS